MRAGRRVTGAGRGAGVRWPAAREGVFGVGVGVDVGTGSREGVPRPALGLVAFLSLAALLPFATLGCGPSPEAIRARDPRPNVLLISIDTVRADHLSTYGYARPTSPRLSELAADGTRVRDAYAPSATTGPSHASLFTSLPPFAHGVRKNGHVLADEQTTLAERLAARGFETGAVVSSFVLGRRFGYDQGFAAYDDDFSEADTPEGTTHWEGEAIEERFYGRADDTTDRALRWLASRSRPDRPFFLFVHYFDPHDPYLPPSDFAPPFPVGRKEALKLNRSIFLYDVLLAYTDREIGRLIDGVAAGAGLDDTLVIVTGDHGEGLMTHGHMFHGAQIYEEAVRVPLVLRWPARIPSGRTVDGPFALVDLGAAILDLIGAAGGQAVDAAAPADPATGADAFDAFAVPGATARLLGEVEGAAAPPVFLYRRPYTGEEAAGDGVEAIGEQYGVRDGTWKLIEGPAEARLELYDLASDPGEGTNVSDRHPDRVAALRALIAGWRGRFDEAGPPAAPISEADRARLRAMGYVE